jgi:glycosyltransferase involved in cell wall biosynthesis
MSARLATSPERAQTATVLTDLQSRHAAGPRVLAVARWPVGGIRTHLHYNYTPLAAAGYRFTFVGPADGSLKAVQSGPGWLDGAEFIGVPVRGRSCRLWPEVRGLLSIGRFALVHAHGLTAGVHAALANVGIGVPLVVTLHEPLRPAQFPGLFGRLKRWAMGNLLRRADRIIAVSDDARDNLLSHLPALGGRAHRVITVANGIDTSKYARAIPRADNALRRHLNASLGTALFGFLGRFMPEKGFPVLLGALQQLAERFGPERFHLAAFGTGDYRREYQKRIDEQGLGRVATLLDFVPDVQPVLADLDLVVVPSLWEASSLVSMEAMSAGVPVLGSDCPGLREVLRGTPSVMVKTGDADALREGLSRFLESPWDREARDYAPVARDRFDSSRPARRLQELFDRLVVQP